MKTVALVLMAAAAAVSAQQPIFRVTATQPLQTYQRRPIFAQPVVAPPIVAQPVLAQPIVAQPAYYRSPLPIFRQEAPRPVVPILRQTDIRDDKGYTYSYETGDRTVVQERGLLKPGPEGDFVTTDGSFSFVSPEGVTYTITYKADENGFQAEGAHIPKAPAQKK